MNVRSRMMRGLGVLMMTALATSACARQMVSTNSSLPGAAAPSAGGTPTDVGGASGRGAIDAFLKAVNAQDLQAMSAYWGNTKGLARDQFKRDELEKRLIVMQCLMQHDKYAFVEDRPRLMAGGVQEYLVELTKGKISSRTTFSTVTGPGGKWLVQDVDVSKLRDFCR
ncbi:MAG: hypothetical protein IBJ03_17005 [Gemmatimonadaceae bacterium]|nr:hypothetical protein [Gemmatimonadaceae bacterium]